MWIDTRALFLYAQRIRSHVESRKVNLEKREPL
jgi:hypothetical protein